MVHVLKYCTVPHRSRVLELAQISCNSFPFLLKQKEMVATAKFIKGRAARAQQAALAERKRKALEADA